MDIELINGLFRSRLGGTEQMKAAAKLLNISLATLYRYKKTPEAIPVGKLKKLSQHFGYPIDSTATWSKTDILAGEQRRLELEQQVARPGGRRYVVTPSFTVTCELPELTRQLWEFDYGTRPEQELREYLRIRADRRELYQRSAYESFEIVIGGSYSDFFYGRGRFKGISNEVRKRQIEQILSTFDHEHVHRRVYLEHTPEVPVLLCYSSQIAVLRADDFVVEFSGLTVTKQLLDIFNQYYKDAHLKSPDEVRKFFKAPSESWRTK